MIDIQRVKSDLITRGVKQASETLALQQELAQQNRALDVLEPPFISSVESLIDKHVNKAASLAAVEGVNASMQIALDGMAEAMEKLWTAQVRRTAIVFRDMTLSGIAKSARPHESKDVLGIFDHALQGFIDLFAASKIQGIVETTRNQIAGAINFSIQNEFTNRQMAARIQASAGGVIAKGRAAAIARTETHTAAQFAGDTAAQATGLEFQKIWIATDDERVRTTHTNAEADSRGRVIKLNDSFSVGGFPAMYPGDPSLPAHESINCRCGVSRRPVIAQDL